MSIKIPYFNIFQVLIRLAILCSLYINQMRYIYMQQNLAQQLPFRYLVDSLSLPGSFASWYLLVYLTRSKPTVNKGLIIIVHPRVGSASRVQLGIPQIELWTFFERSYYSGNVLIMICNQLQITQTVILKVDYSDIYLFTK